MKYFLNAIISAILLISCEVANVQDDKKDLSEYGICSVDLSSLTDDYDKLIWKDRDHFILSRVKDNGSPSLDIIKSDQDTVIVYYYEDNGLPSVISDGETYIFLGGYGGNKFRAVSINGEGKSDVVEIDTNIDFDSYLALIENSAKGTAKADDSSNKVKYERELVIKGVAESIWNKFVNKGGFVPGGLSTPLFIMEALGYLISSDEIWVEAVHSTFEWSGYTVIIGEVAITGSTGLIGLGLALCNVWLGEILYPLIDGGYLLPASDPRSAYAEDLDYYYHHINSAVFKTNEHSFSWLGDSYDVELLSSGNFDITASDWYIVDDYPNWVFPSLYDKDGRVFLHVSVGNNALEGSRPRSHSITVKWIDPLQMNKYAYFYVKQSSMPYTEPSSISFKDRTNARVFVHSGDEWQVYAKPDWCITKKVDHYILDIEKDNSVSNPQAGVITLMAKTKGGDFPFYISVYPEEKLSIVGHWRVQESLFMEGGIFTLTDSGQGYLGIVNTGAAKLRWTLNGMSFYLEIDNKVGFSQGDDFLGYKWFYNDKVFDGTINSDGTEISGTMISYSLYGWDTDYRGDPSSGSFRLVKESL